MSFIVLEGPDLSGKSFIIDKLKQYLVPSDRVRYIHEPGSSPFAEPQRALLKQIPVNVWARQLLMQGSRYDMLDHHDWFIDPDILWVVDRYVPSTIVYGTTDGVPLEVIQGMLKLFPVPTPDFTFVLVPTLSTYKARILERSEFDALEDTPERMIETLRRYQTMFNVFDGKKTLIHGDEIIDIILGELEFDQHLTKFLQ